MARQQYQTNPWEKHLEVYRDFSGGLNTMTANENMKDNEFRNLENIDLSEQGSVKRRHGMVPHLVPGTEGKGQGYFRYYKNATEYDEILAVGGSFYVNGTQKTIEEIGTFQTEKSIEGVQFQNKMYFATGTKLVEYDGETFKVAEAYKPEPLEALYIGTNALADNPNDFMQDGEATFMRIDGVTFSQRYGLINQPVTLTAYISKPTEKSVEFQFEYRFPYMEDGKWLLGQDWSNNKTWTLTPDQEGDYQFRINIREAGLTVAETQYLIPKFKVKPSKDPNDVEPDVSYIHRCNRILLHWNRLVLYGDTQNPDMIYISHLNNPNYFPVPHCLRFENGKSEELTSLVQYRDMLIAFTPTTIQALFGKSPMDFHRVTLNTSIGCIAPESVAVLKNYIIFLSLEGVHILKSVGYVNDKANVEKVDAKIDNIVYRDKDAAGLVHNGQYHLVYPSRNERFRMYIDTWAWTKDKSEKIDFHQLWDHSGELFGQSIANGTLSRFDTNTWDDNGYVYADSFETKYFSFGQPYHTKKLKELQLLVSPKYGTITATVYVYADSAKIFNADKSYASVNENGEVEWNVQIDPNFEIPITADAGTVLGDWEVGESPFGVQETVQSKLSLSGKCRSTKIVFQHQEAKPNHVLGLAYIFKTKRP